MLALCCSVLPVASAHATDAKEYSAALESITIEDLGRHVDTLADNRFEGREAGSPGGWSAGIYLSRQMEAIGLRPGGSQRGWFQTFHDGSQRNVLGVLDGSDERLKHEVIVVGAHYDHIGFGRQRGSNGSVGAIHNGADDNASGVASLLEVAEAFKQLPTAPRRTILFALWDGEEQGLLGSRHWNRNPTVRRDSVRMAFNSDMVGRLRNQRVAVHGTRSALGLRRLVSLAATGVDLDMDFIWGVKKNSDHWPFFESGIPILMFHTGRHSDYHRPSDDAHKINRQGMRQVTRLVFRVVAAAADAEALPDFRDAARFEGASHRQRIEMPLATPPPRLGVVWDENDKSAPGLQLTRITADSPAQRVGLRPGDRLLQVDGNELRTGQDLRSTVMQAEGLTTAKVQRAGEPLPLELKVKLVGKPVRIGLAWRTDGAEPGTVLVTRVVRGSPAAIAGLRVRDRIYQIAGRNFTDSDEFRQIVTTLASPIELVIERYGRLETLSLEPPPQSPSVLNR